MKNFGKTEKAVYLYLKDYIEKNAYPPAIREICTALSLKSTSTVHMHLRSLEERGLIKISAGKQRSIQLTENSKTKLNSELIPLLGTVAAGNPIYAYDDIQEYYPLPTAMLHGGNSSDVFMLTVEGSSMIEAGILDGDMIIVHKGIAYENGDIVVVRVFNDTATVKRIYYTENEQKVRLQPENSNMKPLFVSTKDITVVGKVIGIFRKYL
ncbi:MAG: repressor LexA [Clostridia bacterium]|nr:repressor LexA [Clostridia bacterium]